MMCRAKESMPGEKDIELLDMYLDGELDEASGSAVVRRATAEPEFGRELTRLEADRAVRMRVWESCEPTTDDYCDRLLDVIRASRQQPSWLARILGYRQQVAAVAACVAVFIIGWNWGANAGSYRTVPGMVSGSRPVRLITQRPVQGSKPAFEVRVTDGSGNLIDRRLFNTLDEAQRYTQQIQLQLQTPSAH